MKGRAMGYQCWQACTENAAAHRFHRAQGCRGAYTRCNTHCISHCALQAVLLEIAVQNKRGPYKDMWELKKGYRLTGDA